MISCKKCGSEKIERINPNPGCSGFLAICFSCTFLVLGIVFFPFLFVALISFIYGIIMILAAFNKDTKWEWKCKACKSNFIHKLD